MSFELSSEEIKENFYIVTNYNSHLPQYRHETDSLDIEVLKARLCNDFSVKILQLDEVTELFLSGELLIKGAYFYFASSQIESYKGAILDVALSIERSGGVLVPGYDFYLSHENKFYQELYKKQKGIKTPSATLITNTNNLNIKQDFPVVVKNYLGFGSDGVSLVKSEQALYKTAHKNLTNYLLHDLSFSGILKSLIKSRFMYKGKYPRKMGRVVVQEFLPELKYDWKILVFGCQVFALKRFVKNGDFRASGSGMFDFDASPSNDLIKFAIETRKKLYTPFVSLDIAELTNGQFSIIEYQSVHFGLVTALDSKKHYIMDKNADIEKIELNNICIEDIIGASMIEFIRGEYVR